MRLTNTMLGLTDENRPLNEMDESALIEVGNIMVSAFLDATAELLGFIMLPVPASAYHRYGTCRDGIAYCPDGRRS